MNSNTEQFFLDFLQDNPAWEELFETMGRLNDDLNLSTIQQLLDIRNITADSPTEIAEESIRQLGINVSRDMMSYRIDQYKRVIDVLPDYSQLAGTRDWSKFVSFLLGGQFDTTRLWTADYQTFLPTPLGVLIKDGGTWYKTTHVDLEVDAHLIDVGLDLTIDVQAADDIVAALQQIGMTEQEATDWHTNHIGFDPVNIDLVQRTARNVMLNRRMTALFYQWAPIEEVLHGVQTAVNIGLAIYMTAHTVVEPVRRFFVGAPLASSLSFIEPEYVHGGEEVVFGVMVRYSDGTEQTYECYVEDNAYIESRNGNAVVFSEPNAIIAIDLEVTYQGNTHQIATRLFPLGVEPDPVEIWTEAPTLYGNSTNKLRVYGKYVDGTTRDLTASGSITITPDSGAMSGSNLVLPSVTADTEMHITVLYQGQADILHTDTFPVLRSVRELVPETLALIVDDTLTQGADTALQCVVTYNDGTSKIVVPQYLSSSNDVQIVEDVLKSNVRRRDYMTNLVAQFDDNGSVSVTRQIKMRAPLNILADVDIVLPANIMERQNITPKAMGLFVLETATQQQINDRDSSVVVAYQELEGTWFSSEDIPSGIYALPQVNPQTGEFQAPTIDDGYLDFILHVSIVDGSMLRTFSEIFPVYDTVLTPKIVDVVSGSRVKSGDFINLPTVALWSDGSSYAAACAMSVEYIPSASAVEEARARIIELQKQAVAVGADPTVYDPDNPDYSQWVNVEISNGAGTLYDKQLQREQPIQLLYFTGDLHGVARVTMTYEFEGTTITNTRDFQVVPVRALVDTILIEMPDELFDQSRTFARLFATYADGVQEYVQAANWSGVWPDQDTDDYELLRFVPGTYTGTAIVETVEGRVPTDIKDFRQMKISKLPMFDQIGTMQQLATTLYDGAVVQIGKSNETTSAAVRARFYRIETQFEVTIEPTPMPSINTILNSRIEGATSISAAILSESYALVNTYESGGIVQQLDGSYVEGEKKQFDVEVSSDWSIVNSWYFERNDDSAIVLEPTDDTVAEIDQDGNLTVNVNANCAVRIRAQFICDGYAIEKFLTVYINLANTYLRSISIVGPEVYWDQSDRNPTLAYKDGRWYVPYSLRVILQDTTEIETTDATWSIGDDTNVDGVSIDALNGYVYLADAQLSDGRIRINAVYKKINPDTQAVETISGTRVIQMQSTRTITGVAIDLPASNIEPNREYQAVASYERRDEQTGSSAVPDSDTVSFDWQVTSSVPGFTIDAQTGKFQFAPSEQPQTVTIEVTVTEQRTSITTAIDVTCPGIGFPQDLTVVGFVNVRDDSTMQMKAQLGRTGTFVKDDVTASTLWQTTNSKGDTVTLTGVSINAQTGMLTIGKILADVDFGIKATYIENNVRLTQVHYMRAYSSYPRFGTAPFGVNTVAGVEAAITNRLRSSVGGTFVLSPKTDEYGYFISRADYGSAQFAAGADAQGNINPDWAAFDGAKWPVTGNDGQRGPLVLRKTYDNLTESWNVYRTNVRAFGPAVVTVRYE